MSSFVWNTAKQVHGRVYANALRRQRDCLDCLVAGDVDRAIKILESAGARARRLILNTSVKGNPNPKHPRHARAPSPALQVDFFTRARALVKLPEVDDLKFQIALTYQAIEADHGDVLDKSLTVLISRLPSLQRKRAYTDRFLTGGKRGHHLYYSAVTALLHAIIDREQFDLFVVTTNDAATFFREVTVPKLDKGFGWALPNAMRVVGLAGLWWHLGGDQQRAEQKWRLMPQMLRLAVNARVGPVEYPQVKRAFRFLHQTEQLKREPDPESAAAYFRDFVRLRNEEPNIRLLQRFLLGATREKRTRD